MLGNLLLLITSVVVSLGMLEGLLRIQDQLGPLVQLSGFEDHIADFSPTLHHVRSAWSPDQRMRLANANRCNETGHDPTVLFLGDSWVEEGGITEGFARYLDQASGLGSCFRLINGGIGSYAPSLILLKGLAQIPELHPDLLLINIDETDLMDEWLRYRYGSVRDSEGRLIAVVPSLPDLPDLVFTDGFLMLERQPLYLLRWLEKIYFTHVFMPRLRALQAHHFPLPTFENLFGPQRSTLPRQEYAMEVSYFRHRLVEMIERLRNALGVRGRLILTYHPHYLTVAGLESLRYNRIVSDLLREEAHRHGTVFYDATADFTAIHHGQAADAVFRWPDDIYSHLTHPAYVDYGYWLAQKVAPWLDAIAVKDKRGAALSRP